MVKTRSRQFHSILLCTTIRVTIVLCLSAITFLSFTLSATAQELPRSFIPVAAETLSNSFVRCVYKDSKGYMWFGTDDALIRYDGSNAYRYVHDPNDRASISNNSINTILEGADKRLWIGTAQGLCIYNRELDNFTTLDSIKANRNYLNNRYITDLEFDSQGLLWIGTHEGGVNIYDPQKMEFSYITDAPSEGVMPSTNFITVLVNHGDKIWCGSRGGLMLFDARTKKRLPLGPLQRFSTAQISKIIPEKSGDILIATITGQITRLSPGDGHYSFHELLSRDALGNSSNAILALDIDHYGNILAGGESSGFNQIDHTTNKVNHLLGEEGNPKRLPTNSIHSIYADDLGLIWIGTFSDGVFVLDNTRKKFDTNENSFAKAPIEKNEVRSFAEDRHGNVWVALYGFGLAKIDAGSNHVEYADRINRQLTNRDVTSVISCRDDQLWIGTAGKGVIRINPNTNQLFYYSLRSQGFGNDQIFCLYEDKLGTVWAGTWGSGLFFYDKKNDKFVGATEYDQPTHIPNTAYISDIVEDSEGTFWIGTMYGLYELKRKSQNSFTHRLHILENSAGIIKSSQIQAIVEDKNSHDLWIGTTGGLWLKKRDSTQFLSYEMPRGSSNNAIRSILIDKHGNLWSGGNAGLSKFDTKTNTFINYTREDGLKANSFLSKAALQTSNGRFLFGSNHGFDSFFPDSIRTTSAFGKIVLADLKINGQSIKPGAAGSPLKKHISLTSALQLSYDQRSFVIDFVALNYSPSESYTYYYKLDGFDDDWNFTSRSHSATYTNLDPGTYVFVVKAANREGVTVDKPLELEITIRPVFWKTWWAFCIYIFTGMLFIYALIKIRVERLKMRNEITIEKFKREQEHELSESKTQFFTNIAHEFRTPLSLVLIPLESLMETNEVPSLLRERIFTAYKNADRMKRLVNEFLDFNKLEVGNLKLKVQHGEIVQFITECCSAFNEMAAKRGIRFCLSCDESVIMGWFDRDKLESIIFNVLSNAFKFTADSGEIKLHLKTSHSVITDGTLSRCLVLTIEDNGIGILPEELPRIFEKFYQAKSSSKISSPGTGIGLSLTKALVELHGGNITVESTPDQATTFTILLPIGSNIYELSDAALDLPDVNYTKDNSDAVNLLKGEEFEYTDTDNNTDKPEVLVVEDNFELREYLIAELKREFSVFEARDGEEGLAIALSKNPDLIISDIRMPKKDGIELCNAIKSDLNTSHIPFVLLTAKATIEDQIKGIKTGADLYLSKPFNIRYLIEHVRQIINSRRKLYARFSHDVYLTPGKATTNALDQAFLQKAIDYVANNLQDSQLSVDSMAAVFSLSRMQVYRKIKSLTGKSIVEFIRMVRMKQAIKLMDEHKLTLSEIAFEVGFNSASYFTRCFKEEYGKTPSEYLDHASVK
ncbi:two-component regulator propeller domain-containing protein [Chryseolinea sp. T2]|uniref:hybrid sensor histidine kinase/response regulator transcription factor n=1 Tax=Chryseolinea sp. T2 TaxID=3129255 RepID=UPI003076A47A